jgi:hypothetical protein
MLTIIPINVMRNVSTMQMLFDGFCNACNLIRMTNNGDAETSFPIFHPKIDYKRFMHASIPVLHYILQNIFIKPYIGIMVQRDVDFSWSCFILVNAGKIDREGGTACGFLHFDPNDPTMMDC